MAVDSVNEYFDKVDVTPFVETTDVVSFVDSTVVEDGVDGTSMIFDKEPVANIFALSVDGKRLTMTYVIDEKRYQFFGELVGTVIVRAVGDNGGHAICIVIGSNEMVACSFTCRVRAVRVVTGVLGKERIVEW